MQLHHKQEEKLWIVKSSEPRVSACFMGNFLSKPGLLHDAQQYAVDRLSFSQGQSGKWYLCAVEGGGASKRVGCACH